MAERHPLLTTPGFREALAGCLNLDEVKRVLRKRRRLLGREDKGDDARTLALLARHAPLVDEEIAELLAAAPASVAEAVFQREEGREEVAGQLLERLLADWEDRQGRPCMGGRTQAEQLRIFAERGLLRPESPEYRRLFQAFDWATRGNYVPAWEALKGPVRALLSTTALDAEELLEWVRCATRQSDTQVVPVAVANPGANLEVWRAALRDRWSGALMRALAHQPQAIRDPEIGGVVRTYGRYRDITVRILLLPGADAEEFADAVRALWSPDAGGGAQWRMQQMREILERAEPRQLQGLSLLDWSRLMAAEEEWLRSAVQRAWARCPLASGRVDGTSEEERVRPAALRAQGSLEEARERGLDCALFRAR